MPDTVEIYNAIRAEILDNHNLMHWYSLVVVIVLLAGVWIVEVRPTILSIFLPIISVAWAAAMVRFDLFIHRQGAYLRYLEAEMTDNNSSIQLWETWKVGLRATPYVVPIADLFAVAVVVTPTIYLLFGPSQQFFKSRQWKGGSVYAWSLTVLLFLLLSSLLVIPKIADWGH
ncbi:MAG TPA: hypothetical protein VF131_17815 [Blastocatellia bacterium]|nr:hypothetical protein [Blastocatellia bacterium]